MKNKEKDNRTAQFMPFNALNNLMKKIKEAEEEVENDFEVILLEDEENIINNTLIKIKNNDNIYLEYVIDKRKYKEKGIVKKIDLDNKYLKLNQKKIIFKNIIKINII